MLWGIMGMGKLTLIWGHYVGKWVGKKGCFWGEKGVEFHFCG